MTRPQGELVALLEHVRDNLRGPLKVSKLLGTIGWSEEVERDFFKHKGERLPRVTYEVDRDAVSDRVKSLMQFEKTIDGDDSVADWLRGLVHSFVDANRMILAAGTREFYEVSKEVYGSARTPIFGADLTNVDLADHLLERLHDHGYDDVHDEEDPQPCSAEEFAASLRERLARREPKMEVEVLVDRDCAAKTLAGMSRVRIREDATFNHTEIEQLWYHEVETHALTAQNGAAQPYVSFLSTGGPRATRTQEGVAIFTELYHRCLSIERMKRLARRVKLVQMAEDGADFLQVYRYLIEHGSTERDAFFDAQRIFRGGLIDGRAPFTKDACYLAGLLQVYAFMSVAVRAGMRDEAELLVAGRISLDDLPVLIDLRRRELISRPKYLPLWIERWKELLPYFAFTSFVMGEVSMSKVEKAYSDVLQKARAQAIPIG